MKTDSEVHLMLRERKNGKTLEQAAARAGMSVPTAASISAPPSSQARSNHHELSEPSQSFRC
jgi:hypothetical protein